MPGGADFPFPAFYGIINSAVSGMHRNVLMQKLFPQAFSPKNYWTNHRLSIIMREKSAKDELRLYGSCSKILFVLIPASLTMLLIL
jgi:hypothetical protein